MSENSNEQYSININLAMFEVIKQAYNLPENSKPTLTFLNKLKNSEHLDKINLSLISSKEVFIEEEPPTYKWQQHPMYVFTSGNQSIGVPISRLPKVLMGRLRKFKKSNPQTKSITIRYNGSNFTNLDYKLNSNFNFYYNRKDGITTAILVDRWHLILNPKADTLVLEVAKGEEILIHHKDVIKLMNNHLKSLSLRTK